MGWIIKPIFTTETRRHGEKQRPGGRAYRGSTRMIADQEEQNLTTDRTGKGPTSGNLWWVSKPIKYENLYKKG
jgi:hypothetical protein